MDVPSPDLAYFTATHAEHLVELVKRWGITREQLFDGLPVDEATVRDPKGKLPLPVLVQIGERAKELTGEPGLGFYIGLMMRASSYGYLGFAAMASATLGDALDVGVKFMPTRTNAIALRPRVNGDVASVVIEELVPLGAGADTIIFSVIIGLQAVAQSITGKEICGSIDIALPEPPYLPRFRHLLRGTVRFDQPVHQLLFDAKLLELPLIMADKSALALASELCERELAELGYGPRDVTRRVRALMVQRETGFPSLEEAAKTLGFSVRTLKRRLDDEGSSFSTLLDEERRARALLLLRTSDLSIDNVSDRVGYSDLANFTRAFRRWTGVTPTAYRRNGKARASREEVVEERGE